MLPLFASLLALALGPILYAWTRRGAWAALVDAFALVAVGGLVLVHVLPQSFRLAGWASVAVAVLGLFGPGLLCGTRLFAGRSSGRVTLPVALFGIALHAVLDGFALASPNADPNAMGLATAVILHRLPVGLGIWWLARPLYGRRVALRLLGAIAIFTVVGYAFGEPLLWGLSGRWMGLFQALIAGSLLHVILRHPPPSPDGTHVHGSRAASGLGGLLGVGLVVALELFPGGEAVSTHTSAGGVETGFLRLALESAPALLLAYLAIALLHAWNLNLVRLFARGGPLSQALKGAALGLPVPICSCGVVPLYRSLVVSRVPTPAAMAFLVAAPELGFAALFLSWRLLGGEITLARALCAILLALAIGLWVGRRAPRSSETEAASDTLERQEPVPWLARLGRGLRYGFGDMVDGTAPWILVGLALAAIAEHGIEPEQLRAVPDLLQVPLFALIGLPLYVCASGSTPLAAVLIAQGVSPGAAIAFLLTGPATNLTTFGLLSQLHSKRTAALFAGLAVTLTVAFGWISNALLGGAAGEVAHRLHDTPTGSLEAVSLALLALLVAVSLLRQGTRGFLGQVTSPHGSHAHAGHSHDPEAGCCAPVPAVE